MIPPTISPTTGFLRALFATFRALAKVAESWVRFKWFLHVGHRIAARRDLKRFPIAKGPTLDAIGLNYGVIRKRRLWILRESDRAYRGRIRNGFRGRVIRATLGVPLKTEDGR